MTSRCGRSPPTSCAIERARFESALLGFLRDPRNANARQQMRDALGDLEQLPQRGLARSFWWVVRGLLEALQGDECRSTSISSAFSRA